jgi:Putative amidase domain
MTPAGLLHTDRRRGWLCALAGSVLLAATLLADGTAAASPATPTAAARLQLAKGPASALGQARAAAAAKSARPQAPPPPSYVQTSNVYGNDLARGHDGLRGYGREEVTDTLTPVLSGVIQDAAGGLVKGEFFLLTAEGKPIGGSPTGLGDVPSGTRITYQIPSGVLVNGRSYLWYMKACYAGSCSRPARLQRFRVSAVALSKSEARLVNDSRGAPTHLAVTPGDGGALAVWKPPGLSDSGQAVTSYTVRATTLAGVPVFKTTTTNDYAVVTGLTNHRPYMITVAATRVNGRYGRPARSFVRPYRVPFAAADVAAVREFLAGQTQLQEGTAPTAQAALRTGTESSAVAPELADEQRADVAVRNAAAADDGREANGINRLSGILVTARFPWIINVYVTDELTYTTITGVGKPDRQSTGSADLEDYLFSFIGGRSLRMTGYVDADDALDQAIEGDSATAVSSSLNDYAGTTVPKGLVMPPPATAGPASARTKPEATTAPVQADLSRSGEVKWALQNWNGGKDGYGDDCTDFASRAMHIGGGAIFDINTLSPFNRKDDHYWYNTAFFLPGFYVHTYSWGSAPHLADHLWLRGNTWLKYYSSAKPGDLIFANWSGGVFINLRNGAKDTITHVGVITKMSNGVPLITQHTNDRRNEPIWRWLATGPHVHVWVVIPDPS